MEPPDNGAAGEVCPKVEVEDDTAGGVQNRGGPAAPPLTEGGPPRAAPGRFPDEVVAGIRTGGGAINAARGSPDSVGAEGAEP